MSRTGILATMAAFALTATVVAQQPPPEKTVKRVPIEMTSMADGAEMYAAYCAACHGKEGRGDGPAAPAFKTPPTNLTGLSAKNGGKFPELDVANTLQWGPKASSAHGSKEMPVWGTVFSSIGDQAQTKQRIYNLTKHVESLQVKR